MMTALELTVNCAAQWHRDMHAARDMQMYCESSFETTIRRERRCYGALHSRSVYCYESISQSTAEVLPSSQGCIRHSIPRISYSTRGHAYCKQLRCGLERWTALLAAETVTLCSAVGARCVCRPVAHAVGSLSGSGRGLDQGGDGPKFRDVHKRTKQMENRSPLASQT